MVPEKWPSLQMEVSPLRKLSKQWTSSRGLYLALQEEKLQKQHYDCAEKLEALATRLEVVQSLQGSTLCRALHSPASAVETLQQLEVNLRSVKRPAPTHSRHCRAIESRSPPLTYRPRRSQVYGHLNKARAVTSPCACGPVDALNSLRSCCSRSSTLSSPAARPPRTCQRKLSLPARAAAKRRRRSISPTFSVACK